MNILEELALLKAAEEKFKEQPIVHLEELKKRMFPEVKQSIDRNGNHTELGMESRMSAKSCNNGPPSGKRWTQRRMNTHEVWEHLMACGGYKMIWKDFGRFCKDMGLVPSPRHILSKRDFSKAHGPQNSYWKERQPEPIYKEMEVEDQVTQAQTVARKMIEQTPKHIRDAMFNSGH